MDTKESPKGLLRERQVLELIPISRATLWRWVAGGRFPRPVKLGAITAWPADAVAAFIQDAKGQIHE